MKFRILFILALFAASVAWADSFACTGSRNSLYMTESGIFADLLTGQICMTDTEIFVPAGKGFAYFEHIRDDGSKEVIRINPRREDGNFEGDLRTASAMFGR